MRAVCVLIVCVLSLWTVQPGQALPWKQQKTYSSSQFPQSQLLQKTPHFEYRSFEPSTLVSTGVPVNASINELFDKLTNLAGYKTVDRLLAIHGHPCKMPGRHDNKYSCTVDSYTSKLWCYAYDKYTRREDHPYLLKRDCSYEGLGIKDIGGTPCFFPFNYRNVWYHACTTMRAGNKLWCSHTVEYDGKWGYCPEVRENPDTYPKPSVFGDLPKLNVAYVLPREMEAEALAGTPGNDVTVTSVPAGNICSRALETADMTYEMVLATAGELVKQCRHAGHNHARISLVKYQDKDEPRVEMWFM